MGDRDGRYRLQIEMGDRHWRERWVIDIEDIDGRYRCEVDKGDGDE